MLKMRNLGILSLGALLLMQACGSEASYETTESGVQYRFITDAGGETPQDGEVLTLNMRYVDAEDSVLFDSNDQGAPVPIQYNDTLWRNSGSIEEGFRMLKKGDSLEMKVKAEELYAKTFGVPVPDGVDGSSDVTFYIGVVDVQSEDEYREHQMKQYERQQEELSKRMDGQLDEDVEQIDAYLSENNINAQQTESGLRYVIKKEGSGKKPSSGDTVKVEYTGKLLNGEVFDSSIESVAKENDIYNEGRTYEPLEFVHDQGMMIPGFDEGVAYLGEGGEAQLFIPSPLGYGERAAGEKIQPFSILVFDIKVVEVQ